MTSKLEQIRNSLDKYINEELEKSPPDRDWEVFSFEDDLYEIIESFDQIIYYDPTPWLKIYLILRFVLTVVYPAILVRVDLLTDIQFTMMMLKVGGAETVPQK